MPLGFVVRADPGNDRVIRMIDEVFANQSVHSVVVAGEVGSADGDELAVSCRPSDLAGAGERRIRTSVEERGDDEDRGVVTRTQSGDRPGGRAFGRGCEVLDEDLEFGIVHATSVRPLLGAPLTAR